MSRLEVQADHLELRRLRPWLDEVANDLDPTALGRIELCLHELSANVVDHSGADEFTLELTRDSRRITIELSDRGQPLALPGGGELEPHPRVRGYGMMIAEHLADELVYERSGTTNTWHVTFNL